MTIRRENKPTACEDPVALGARPLISPIQAGAMAAVFKVLANDTRLRLLHALARAGQLCVTDLAATLAMKPQAVSNQLQRLADLGVVSSRREGNNVYYRVSDGCTVGLLSQAWCLLETAGPTRPRSEFAPCCEGQS